jgi:hypothetical protein
MLGKILPAWLLFVSISGIAETIFILFSGNYFQGFEQTLDMIFPQMQNDVAISSALRPFIANPTLTVTIWTLTSMAISLEMVFVPLLLPGKMNCL